MIRQGTRGGDCDRRRLLQTGGDGGDLPGRQVHGRQRSVPGLGEIGVGLAGIQGHSRQLPGRCVEVGSQELGGARWQGHLPEPPLSRHVRGRPRGIEVDAPGVVEERSDHVRLSRGEIHRGEHSGLRIFIEFRHPGLRAGRVHRHASGRSQPRAQAGERAALEIDRHEVVPFAGVGQGSLRMDSQALQAGETLRHRRKSPGGAIVDSQPAEFREVDLPLPRSEGHPLR